jgi:hypothetical protein
MKLRLIGPLIILSFALVFFNSCAANKYSEREFDELYYTPAKTNPASQMSLNGAPTLNDTSRTDNKKINFSIFSGLSFTQFIGNSDDFAELLNNSTGLQLEKKFRSFIFPFGLSLSLNATSWLTLKTAVMFAPKGIKYSDKIETGGEEYMINLILKLNYIEIPFLLEVSTPVDRISRFYLNGGIAPAFKVTSSIISKAWNINSYPGQSDTQHQTEKWKEVNNIDLGYIIGCGIKGQTTYMGIQYGKGLKSVSTTGWDFKNQTITVLLGFYF